MSHITCATYIKAPKCKRFGCHKIHMWDEEIKGYVCIECEYAANELNSESNLNYITKR